MTISAVLFGPHRLAIYNELYADVLGQKHPHSLGQSFADIWSEPGLAEEYLAIFDAIEVSGKTAAGDDAIFITDRNGFREEMHTSWCFSPMVDTAGNFYAIYGVIIDSTEKNLSARRLNTLMSLSQHTSSARTIPEFWSQVLQGCDTHNPDILFAVLYSLALDREDKHLVTEQDQREWSLEGSIGLGHSLPKTVNCLSASTLITPVFRAAIASAEPFLLTTKDGSLPELLRGVAKFEKFQEVCQSAVVFPICPANRDDSMGFMIIGLNPVTQYDSAYQQFIQHLVRQCANSLASILIVEEETQKTQVAVQAATQDRIKLSAKLADKQKEIQEHKVRFRAMADLAPVGMFHIDGDGTMLYANRRWLELTRHYHEKWAPMSWMEAIYADDVPLLEECWAAVQRGEAVSFETRLNTPWEAPDGIEQPGPSWAICSAYAEIGPDGSTTACLGCLTDISRQKWMETVQERRMEEALELKRQQEHFMDMTSHEARNPLAAIMLCAESSVSTMHDLLQAEEDPVPVRKEVIQLHLESADIILACAQHQKHIMDDVLTLSKLESDLLVLCPLPVQPQATVSQALKMLDAEVQKHDITLKLDATKTFREVLWAQLDSSRLIQVLINLLTNAIKFTRCEKERKITLSMDATDCQPTSSRNGVIYAQDGQLTPGNLPVYLGFEVTDSGRGLTQEEMDRLFQRYQQASPKTHVEYGGSGLGLFICRQLTRLQGGAIGVASSGKGATFAFYITAQRCAAPRKESVNAIEEQKLEKPLETKRSKGYILLVEDNLINQKVIRVQLERLNYTVKVAHHGLDALDNVLSSHFCQEHGDQLEVILMDVEMPVCDGVACTRQIRAMEISGKIRGHVPIIGVTANARMEQQTLAIKAGMDSVVPKPFRLQELAAEIERVSHLCGLGLP